MKQISYVITDELGIHARPAGLLVKAAAGFKSSIKISNGTKEADAKRILGLMGRAIKKGDTATLTIEGPDEDAAAEALEKFFKENL